LVDSHDAETKGAIMAMQDIVNPVFPALYASGCVINGFTPIDRSQTETLVRAIVDFAVDVVLVIDHEKLEKDIINIMKQRHSMHHSKEPLKMPIVLKVPKSPGIQPSRLSADEQERRVINHYDDYFRGKHHATFQKNEHVREELELEPLAVRNELDP
jgi:transcriptional antiterminator